MAFALPGRETCFESKSNCAFSYSYARVADGIATTRFTSASTGWNAVVMR